MGSNEFKKTIARTFIFLLDSKEPSASALLAEALAEKTARIQVWAVLAATRRPDRRLLLDVLRAYGDLCERARRIVIRNGPAFLPVLRDALTADRPSEREGALALACRIGGARTAHLLALALSGRESALREAAAKKLAEIVAEYHRDAAKARGRSNRSRRADLEGRRLALLNPMIEALKSFKSHRDAAILNVAVGLDPRLDDLLIEIFSNPADERLAPLMDVLLKSNDPRVAEFLFEMLRDDDAAAKAEEVFSARSDESFLRSLAHTYRSSRELVLARRLGRLRSLPWAVGAQLPAVLAGMAGEEILGLVVFVLLSGIPVAEKTHSVEGLSGSPSAVVRETGKSVLRSLDSGLTPHEVASRLLQAAERARASAAQAPASAEPRTADGYTVGRLLEEALRLPESERERIARKLADIDPAARGKLAAALRSPQAEQKLNALAVIAPMGLQEGMLDDVLKLAMSGDNHVRASAVKLLGGFKNRESVRALLEAILDLDRRVVANAVEGLGETGMRVLANVVVPLLKHPSGRVRGNAVRALWMLGYPKVASVLRDMAEDRDEAMRLSAVWTMGQIDHPDSRRLLKELAGSDPSDRVRAKAAEIMQRIAAFPFVFALQDRPVGILRQISDGFRNVSVRPVWIAVGVAALLSLFALILLRRKVLPVLYASKNEFLESLCLLHNVAPGEKRLLVRLALEYNVPETAFLFVKAGLAFEILDRMSRSGLLGRRRAKRLAAVCRKIFGLSARSELDSLEV